MTPNDIPCSGDTTVLIKAIRALPGSSWMPYLPLGLGDACLAPVAVKEGGLGCLGLSHRAQPSSCLEWAGSSFLSSPDALGKIWCSGEPASLQHKGNKVSLEVMP